MSIKLDFSTDDSRYSTPIPPESIEFTPIKGDPNQTVVNPTSLKVPEERFPGNLLEQVAENCNFLRERFWSRMFLKQLEFSTDQEASKKNPLTFREIIVQNAIETRRDRQLSKNLEVLKIS